MTDTENLIKQVSSLSYRERRLFLFGSQRNKSESTRQRFLYKYANLNHPNRLRDVLLDSKLWFSSPNAFNDPFDSRWKTEISSNPTEVRLKITQIMKDHPDLSPKGWKAREQKVFELMRDRSELLKLVEDSSRNNVEEAGVLCLTSEPRSILMWSHYSDHHKGIAFQFELAKDVRFFIRAVSVRYSKIYPVRNWTDSDNTYLKNALFRKFEDWEYEKEKRILIPGYANNYSKFNPTALTGILLGAKFTDYPWLYSVLKERTERYGGDQLKIYSASQSNDSYKLSFNRVLGN